MCKSDFRYIVRSAYFNFHYLPFKQAIHLPILFYKPKFLKLRGKVILRGDIKYGIVRLGFPTVSVYPNSGVLFENHGGTLIFDGRCKIGNNSYISIGNKGICELGDRFNATTSFKLICYHDVRIGDRCMFGWQCLVMDTDFHTIKKAENGEHNRGYAEVHIGSDCWFGFGCSILKKTVLPSKIVISAGTQLSSEISVPNCCVIGCPITPQIKANGFYWDIDDDKIHII